MMARPPQSVRLFSSHNKKSAVALWCAIFAWSILAASMAEETLFVNGVVWTGNPTQPRAEAVLVRDGRIDYVGTSEEAASRRIHAIPVDLTMAGRAHRLCARWGRVLRREGHSADFAELAGEFRPRIAAVRAFEELPGNAVSHHPVGDGGIVDNGPNRAVGVAAQVRAFP